MIEGVTYILDTFMPSLWALVMSSWILSYGVLISLLAIIIRLHGNKSE